MVPALKALWKEAFGDTDQSIDFYFSRRFRCENTLTVLEEGAPTAMLTLLPAKLTVGGGLCPVRYVYAVATRADRRGRGLSTRLLEYAAEYARNRGERLLLVPAESELFAFYEKRGFTPAFSVKEVEFSAESLQTIDTQSVIVGVISDLDYKLERDVRFCREGFLCWNEAAVAYALAENREGGGFACGVDTPMGRGALLCARVDGRLFVREAALCDAALPVALAALMRREGCLAARVRLPAYSEISGEVRPFGMTNALVTDALGYCNLVLD